MDWVYFTCAIAGGTVLVGQIVLMLLGFDQGDVEATDFELDEAGVGGSEFFDYLSLRSMVAFLTFFGLTGMGVQASNWEPFPYAHLVLAMAAGCLAFYVVGAIMIGFRRLHASGNIKLSQAVGQLGTVYLKVPAEHSGAGKVTVEVAQRTVEARATTAGAELPTGSKCQVVSVVGDTLEVTAAS